MMPYNLSHVCYFNAWTGHILQWEIDEAKCKITSLSSLSSFSTPAAWVISNADPSFREAIVCEQMSREEPGEMSGGEPGKEPGEEPASYLLSPNSL